MCIATERQNWGGEPTDSETRSQALLFRDRTIQCLVLGNFTKGGPYVLETMMHNLGTETFLCSDPNVGLWLLLGLTIQIATSQGYHRDPDSFSKISPFVGEMRRRIWGTIVQLDFRLCSQMGLPRLVKPQNCDTSEPRNLLDTDFDEGTVELPPSRPETEVTPILYSLAKNRIDYIGGLISDLLADIHEHQYTEILELHEKVQAAEASLPPIFRWQPISQSLTIPPKIVLFRAWLQLAIQRLVVWLHRKYMAPSYSQEQYAFSRDACVKAAIKILEFQHMMEEETQPSGRLYHVRGMQTSLIQSVFLLGMSVLCYYVQLAKTSPEIPLDQELDSRIRGLLQRTYPLLIRSSTVSRNAREAVKHLSLLLGLDQGQQDNVNIDHGSSYSFASIPQQPSLASMDQITWMTYQGR
jgi:hypothetical protein